MSANVIIDTSSIMVKNNNFDLFPSTANATYTRNLQYFNETIFNGAWTVFNNGTITNINGRMCLTRINNTVTILPYDNTYLSFSMNNPNTGGTVQGRAQISSIPSEYRPKAAIFVAVYMSDSNNNYYMGSVRILANGEITAPYNLNNTASHGNETQAGNLGGSVIVSSGSTFYIRGPITYST